MRDGAKHPYARDYLPHVRCMIMFRARGFLKLNQYRVTRDGRGDMDIQLQQILQAVGAAAAALGDVANDVHDGSEDVAVAISQQSGRLDVVHLGNVLVQLNEAGGGLATGNGDETFLDDGTVVGLEKKSDWMKAHSDNGGTYLRVVDADHHHGIGRHLLNGIEVPRGIDGLHCTPASATRRGAPHAAVLELLHARDAPLVQEPLLVIFTAGRAVGRLGRCLVARGPAKRAIAVEAGGAEQSPPEGLLAGTLKGLGVGDDALGTGIGVEDGVGDVVVVGAGGDHVAVSVLVVGVEDAALAQIAGRGVVVVGEVRAGIAVFGVRGGFVAVVVHQLIEFFLGGHRERKAAGLGWRWDLSGGNPGVA